MKIYASQDYVDSRQPDMLAAEGEPGHVKNRTHWVEEVAIAQAEYAKSGYYDDDLQSSYKYILIENISEIQNGGKFNISFDTMEFNEPETAVHFEDNINIEALSNIGNFVTAESGNEYYFNVDGSNSSYVYEAPGVPYMVILLPEDLVSVGGIYQGWIFANVVVSKDIYHPISPDYLPEGVPYVEEVEEPFINVENMTADTTSVEGIYFNERTPVRVYCTGSTFGEFVADVIWDNSASPICQVVSSDKNLNFYFGIAYAGLYTIDYGDGSEKIDGVLRVSKLVDVLHPLAPSLGGVPTPTADDEGKVLTVSGGEAAWASEYDIALYLVEDDEGNYQLNEEKSLVLPTYTSLLTKLNSGIPIKGGVTAEIATENSVNFFTLDSVIWYPEENRIEIAANLAIGIYLTTDDTITIE